MNILIGNKYKISSDPLNIVLEEAYEKKRESEDDPSEVGWKKVGFYSSISSACNSIVKSEIHLSDAESISDLVECIQLTEARILEAIRESGVTS